MTLPTISIVMPVRNEGDRLYAALRSFVDGRRSNCTLEFVVVDDASEDGCCDYAEQIVRSKGDGVSIQVIRLSQWSGIPYARNRGALTARGSILFMTDANVAACPGWDIPISRDLHANRVLCATVADMASSWAAYGCLLHLPSMGVRWLSSPQAYGGLVPVAPSAGTILQAELFHRIGGYDSAMPAYGAAEPEFSVRAWLSGAEIRTCPDVVLHHRFRPAEERRPFLDRIAPLQIHNYLRFGLLYLDDEGAIGLLSHWSRHAPAHFSEALRAAVAHGVWARRDLLRRVLPREFDWYAKYFRLWDMSRRLAS
jgi:glycosyltransferase involved in cell wall biosynthesis